MQSEIRKSKIHKEQSESESPSHILCFWSKICKLLNCILVSSPATYPAARLIHVFIPNIHTRKVLCLCAIILPQTTKPNHFAEIADLSFILTTFVLLSWSTVDIRWFALIVRKYRNNFSTLPMISLVYYIPSFVKAYEVWRGQPWNEKKANAFVDPACVWCMPNIWKVHPGVSCFVDNMKPASISIFVTKPVCYLSSYRQSERERGRQT